MAPLKTRLMGMTLMLATLGACSLPPRVPAPQIHDFGLPAEPTPSATDTTRTALALKVQSSTALDSTAMLYRLAYADDSQLRGYSQSRWAMTPAELLQQRLRDGLGRRFVVHPNEGGGRLLYVELEEFSQVFAAPGESKAVLRLRASVLQRTAGGEQLLAQRELQMQRPAATADAPGGVRALSAATEAAVTELVHWLQTLR